MKKIWYDYCTEGATACHFDMVGGPIGYMGSPPAGARIPPPQYGRLDAHRGGRFRLRIVLVKIPEKIWALFFRKSD